MNGSNIGKFWVIPIKINLLARTLPPPHFLLVGKQYSSVLGTRDGNHMLRMAEPTGQPVTLNDLVKLPTCPRLLSRL